MTLRGGNQRLCLSTYSQLIMSPSPYFRNWGTGGTACDYIRPYRNQARIPIMVPQDHDAQPGVIALFNVRQLSLQETDGQSALTNYNTTPKHLAVAGKSQGLPGTSAVYDAMRMATQQGRLQG